jgi:hypothetical protein
VTVSGEKTLSSKFVTISSSTETFSNKLLEDLCAIASARSAALGRTAECETRKPASRGAVLNEEPEISLSGVEVEATGCEAQYLPGFRDGV